MLNKSGITGPHAFQTSVVAALLQAKCDRPTAAFKELQAVANDQLTRLVKDHSDPKDLGAELRKLCMAKK
eukprot:482869-Alexandrium_andersonii.AAC.1